MSFQHQQYKQILSFIDVNCRNSTNIPKIIAISKNHPISSVREAIDSGVRIFGENKVQEALSKFSDLKKQHNRIELHLTGPLQTNKVKSALSIFDIFQTLDREKLAIEFNKHIAKNSDKKFFIQVNTGMEKQKTGIHPASSSDFVDFCQHDLNLSIIGLMCMPPINDDPTKHFAILRNLAKKKNLQFLSMGMSADYKKALMLGATHIRIGTLLFGSR
jgi:hypothetical protein